MSTEERTYSPVSAFRGAREGIGQYFNLAGKPRDAVGAVLGAGAPAMQALNPFSYLFGGDEEAPAAPAGQPAAVGTPERAPATDGPSTLEALQALRDALAEEFAATSNPEEKADLAQQMLATEQDIVSLSMLNSGVIALEDGTLLTQEMLNHSDPYLRQQYQQEWNRRQAAITDAANAALNQYDLDEYSLARQAAQDANATRTAAFNAQMSSIGKRLELNAITIDQAVAEAKRVFDGMAEGRARADLETDTAMKAAPWSTGGKTEFSPADTGMTRLAQLAGIRDMNAPVIRYPGSMTIDPRGAMEEWDRRIGVEGGTQPIPKVTVQESEIPRGVGLTEMPGTPRLRRPSIQMPAGPMFPAAAPQPAAVGATIRMP